MTAPTPPAAAPAAPPRVKPPPNQLTIISHSTLYYWWPVWLCGFIMAGVTYFEGYVMAVVPQGKDKETGVAVDANVSVKTPARNDKNELIVEGTTPKFDETNHEEVVVIYGPAGGDRADVYHEGVGAARHPKTPNLLHMSPHKALGVTFVIVLLLVLTITNVPMRGMWSVLVIVVAVSLTVIFIVTGFWETLLTWLFWLDVRINMAGYLTISIFLLIIWALAVFFFDKQRYITFTAGQFRVCDEIGGGEQVYSTDGMQLQKQRSDLFRHYILGLGSGDLIVRTGGGQGHHYDLPNVLFINSKVRQIEELISRKVVVDTH